MARYLEWCEQYMEDIDQINDQTITILDINFINFKQINHNTISIPQFIPCHSNLNLYFGICHSSHLFFQFNELYELIEKGDWDLWNLVISKSVFLPFNYTRFIFEIEGSYVLKNILIGFNDTPIGRVMSYSVEVTNLQRRNIAMLCKMLVKILWILELLDSSLFEYSNYPSSWALATWSKILILYLI